MKEIMKGLARGIMAMVLLLAGACTEENLDKRTSGYVEIALNWDEHFDAAANASMDASGKATPDGGRIYFFPESGDAFYRDCPKEGFKGVVPAGKYRIVAMNRNRKNTSDLVDENGKVACSYETARLDVLDAANATAITAANAAARTATKAASDAPVIGQPASVFVSHGFDDGSDVLEVKASRDERAIASTSPKSMVKRVRFTITVENFTVHGCHCVFGGIARAILCSTGTCIQEPARVKFDASGTEDPNRFTATFNVFDLITPGVQTHPLELTLELDSGTKTTTVDLSGSVEKGLESSGDFSYEIPLDLNIEVTQAIDGSISATVEEWAGGGSGSGVGGY